MFGILLSTLLLFQSLDVDPKLIGIPPDSPPYAAWPDYEADPNVGYETFTITYNVGPNGFAAGGKLRFMFAYLSDHANDGNPAFTDVFGWMQVPTNATSQSPLGRWQLTSPSDPNYTTAFCASTNLKKRRIFQNLMSILEIEPVNNVAPNDDIIIIFGDISQGSLGTTISRNPGHPNLVVFEDENNDGTFAPVNVTYPKVYFTGIQVDGFIINVPMYTIVGVPFEVTIQAIQGRDDSPQSVICPVEWFSGNVDLSASMSNMTLPLNVNIAPGNNGKARFTATCNNPGYFYISANLTNILYTQSISNIARCLPVNSQLQWRIYPGDLQRHSAEGGHAGVPDNMTWNILYDNNDNFGTVVQHVNYNYAGFRGANLSQSRFQNLIDPGELSFIAFPGYEWSLPGAHRHVISKFTTNDLAFSDDIYNGFDTPAPILATTVTDLLNGLKNQATPQIAIIHHSLWNKTDFPDQLFDWGIATNHKVQRLVEIYSHHGSSERYYDTITESNYVMKHDINLQRPTSELASVADALNMGYKFGIIGGSDRHAYGQFIFHQISANNAYSRPGLGFVLGKITTNGLRERIWEGLYNRKTYATTGAKIHLMFRGNGAMMGNTLTVPTVDFNIEAHASGITNRIVNSKFILLEVFRDGYDLVLSQTLDAEYININWQDPSPLNDGLEHSYFVRLTQNDNHVAWSSPIWWLKL